MPHTFAGLFDRATSWENLIRAYKETRDKKKKRLAAVLVHGEYDVILCKLRDELLAGTWKPAPYKSFEVWNGTKKRHIEAPAFKDRIVHHAICQVLEPLYAKKFISDTYACQKGRGPHAAAARLEEYLRRLCAVSGCCYVLKCDVSKFFPSIDHDILISVIARTVREDKMLKLIRRAMASPDNDTGRGIPIGSLTSQLLSNAYLDPFDHFIKEQLRTRYYVRYADDFVILDPSKEKLQETLGQIAQYLAEKLALRLNPKTGIYKSYQGVDFCGYRIWATHRLPRKRVVKDGKKRLLRLLWQYIYGREDAYTVSQSFASLKGYMSHCKGHRTTMSLFQMLKGWFEKHARNKNKRE
jgi:retron-type reverse transcriptase